LAVSVLLLRRGYSVTLYEQAPRLGGALSTFVRGGFRFDTGFHYTGGIYGPLREILEELDLLSLPWHPLDADAFDRVYYGGKEYLIGEQSPLTSDDPLERQLLAGNAFCMQLHPELDGSVFREVESSFRQGAYRLKGGAGQLVDRLASQIQSLGGEIRTNTRVASVEAMLKEGLVVSTIHPQALMRMMDAPVRPVFRRRIEGLPLSRGMFTAHLLLEKGMIPYRNCNLFIYRGDPDLWSEAVPQGVMVHFYVPEQGEYAEAIDLLMPMDWQEVNGFCSGSPEYTAFKHQRAEEMIALASTVVSGLQEAVRDCWTSSPLTWQRYTLAPEGSAFGTLHLTSSPDSGFLSPKTPVDGLFLTGQSIGIHGFKGTLMSVINTVNQICMHS